MTGTKGHRRISNFLAALGTSDIGGEQVETLKSLLVSLYTSMLDPHVRWMCGYLRSEWRLMPSAAKRRDEWVETLKLLQLSLYTVLGPYIILMEQVIHL
jgi:hypothetical protein